MLRQNKTQQIPLEISRKQKISSDHEIGSSNFDDDATGEDVSVLDTINL